MPGAWRICIAGYARPEKQRAFDNDPYTHIVTHMKTTLELPDELFARTKIAAAQRKTTFRAIVEHALRREVGGGEGGESPYFTIGADGIPRIRRSGNVRITSAMVRELMEEE